MRETWGLAGTPERIVYRAAPADDYQWGSGKPSQAGFRWRPSIHMPRWASRITLEVTGIRVERLNDITNEDAQAEGARYFPDIPEPRRHPYRVTPPRWSMFSPASTDECMHSAKMAFANGWDHVNGKRAPWANNPWVWVGSFKKPDLA